MVMSQSVLRQEDKLEFSLGTSSVVHIMCPIIRAQELKLSRPRGLHPWQRSNFSGQRHLILNFDLFDEGQFKCTEMREFS